ncbi:hypothetical protein WH43_13550 [Rheinheimera sp. KL1]|nr:hypothetical protein WH43_13550 [Rheinheimera sp. KL1]
MPKYPPIYNKARRASATQPFQFIFLTELMKKHDATISQGKTKNILRRYTAHGRHEQPISRSTTSHNAFGTTSRINTKNTNAIIIGKKGSHKIKLGDSLRLAKIATPATNASNVLRVEPQSGVLMAIVRARFNCNEHDAPLNTYRGQPQLLDLPFLELLTQYILYLSFLQTCLLKPCGHYLKNAG